MPIGEDIPILIPIAIILVVVMLFLLPLFINFSEQSDIIRMSQTSLDIGEYIIYINSNELGNLNISTLNSYSEASLNCPNKCSKLSKLNISSNYRTSILINDTTSDRCWCWGNIYEAKDVVITNIPTLIIENEKTIPAMVKVSVSK